MAIEITCPRCKSESTHPEEWAGRTVKCGHCRHMLELPTLEQLARAEAVREGLGQSPSWRATDATVWVLRAICLLCLITGAVSLILGVNDRPLIVLGALASAGVMLYLAESLRLRLIDARRPPPRP